MKVGELDIAITKSDRKTVSIFVERDGSVSAIVPQTLTETEIKDIIESKNYHIHKNKAEWEQLNERRVLREYVSGQSFMYLGRNYRLKLVDKNLGRLVFNKGTFYLGRDEIQKGDAYFTEFYKGKLLNKIKPIVTSYEQRLGVKANEIKVMDLQHRWASCTKAGAINFHWKCAMAPINVLQYITAHELAHLIHLNHSTAFWNEVDKVLPNYTEQMNWLKYNGAGMSL